MTGQEQELNLEWRARYNAADNADSRGGIFG
jgi:hypothetical protein